MERHTLATGAADTVGTTGIIELKPNAVNSVPREARVSVDIRDIDSGRRDSVVDAVVSSAKHIAGKRSVRYAVEFMYRDPPATCEPAIVDAVEEASNGLGLSVKRMVSRAYHDTLFMARVVPAGMIFIPCRNGVSHRPDEFASEKAIGDGVSALAMAMAKLSGGRFLESKQEL